MDVRFMAAGGTTECSPWSAAAAEVPFEQCPPLKPFPVRKGKRTAPGWWWAATTGRLVHYGSGPMRLHVMLLDRDPRVTYLASQPLELRWRERDEVRTHVPQMMLRLADGQGVLADCLAGEELSPRQRSLAAVLGEVCAAVGWRYWVLGPVDPVYRRNVACWPGTGIRGTTGDSSWRRRWGSRSPGVRRCGRECAGPPGIRWWSFLRCSMRCGRSGCLPLVDVRQGGAGTAPR
ncbi:TnsA-like heteromeric transposase endonuclease subunit [Streptomyces sp. SID9727]|nr:TnsA-like heteromeric transposase endonuclease subunit [Streptomyces sp. SID9727]